MSAMTSAGWGLAHEEERQEQQPQEQRQSWMPFDPSDERSASSEMPQHPPSEEQQQNDLGIWGSHDQGTATQLALVGK